MDDVTEFRQARFERAVARAREEAVFHYEVATRLSRDVVPILRWMFALLWTALLLVAYFVGIVPAWLAILLAPSGAVALARLARLPATRVMERAQACEARADDFERQIRELSSGLTSDDTGE